MSRYVEVHVDEVVRTTDKAALCRIDGEEHWIPHSQVNEETPLVVGECEVTVEITRWLAEQRGLA